MDLPGDNRFQQKVENNDETFFEVLFEKYHRQLFLLALQYLQDEKLAEDAIQDVFLKVWEKRDQLNASRSVKGYLFTTLKNHVLNMIRNRKRRVANTREAGKRKPNAVKNTEEEVALNEYWKIVEKGMNELPAGKQKVFRLRRIQGYTNREVASALQISITTVKSQLYKATKFMRSFVKDHADI